MRVSQAAGPQPGKPAGLRRPRTTHALLRDYLEMQFVGGKETQYYETEHAKRVAHARQRQAKAGGEAWVEAQPEDLAQLPAMALRTHDGARSRRKLIRRG